MLLVRAANSEGSPLGRLSELRVASGFAVRTITGASIESRLGEDSTSCTLFPPCLSRLQATGLNLWDNKECAARQHHHTTSASGSGDSTETQGTGLKNRTPTERPIKV
ncbi:unnamed protein product [Lasius platythorax]|uniref:Uncharacterized protein n=1 Tax=Lasius platythorax TaxID=488582 RepID=A0AAV2N7A7_9HYME